MSIKPSKHLHRDSSLSIAAQAIAKHTPQLAINSLELLGSGSDSTAFLVNEQWIFRFTNDGPGSQQSLHHEISLLPKLKDVLAVKIPRFQYIAYDSDHILYVGYEALPGLALEHKIFLNLPSVEQQHLLGELANFMQSLHHFPLKSVIEAGITPEIFKGAYHPAQRQLLKDNYHRFTQQELAKMEAMFACYERQEYPLSTATLLHADLKPEHILFYPESGQLSGILDWGDICIGDPDYDFTTLYLYFGHEFIIKLLNYFPDKDPDQVLFKIQFFITIRWLQDITLFSTSNDLPMLDYCLKQLRQHLQQPI